eukprot:scaffold2012_cov228-Pinguiococcus_pyrenoidosus.AAC.6
MEPHRACARREGEPRNCGVTPSSVADVGAACRTGLQPDQARHNHSTVGCTSSKSRQRAVALQASQGSERLHFKQVKAASDALALDLLQVGGCSQLSAAAAALALPAAQQQQRDCWVYARGHNTRSFLAPTPRGAQRRTKGIFDSVPKKLAGSLRKNKTMMKKEEDEEKRRR